jgi:hypothetical protein
MDTQPDTQPVSERRAYDDASTPHQMYDDCRAVGVKLRYDRIARAAAKPAPSLHFEDFPREVLKREIEVSEAAARLASAIFDS